MWNLKRNDTNEFTHKIETDLENELIVAINCWDGEGWRTGIVREFVYTAIFKMDNQQGSATAHGPLLSVIWQPGWEGSLGANAHLYMYGWVPLLFT